MSIENPGKYRARCIDDTSAIRWGRSKNGNEQIALTFALTDDEGHTTDTTIDWVGTFANDKASEITVKALRVCGWAGDSIDDLSGINANEVELDIQWDEYEGQRHLRVKWVNRPGGNRIAFKDSLDAGGKKALAARLRGVIAGNKAAAGAKPPADADTPDWAR